MGVETYKITDLLADGAGCINAMVVDGDACSPRLGHFHCDKPPLAVGFEGVGGRPGPHLGQFYKGPSQHFSIIKYGHSLAC
jgi:hypothetical protein